MANLRIVYNNVLAQNASLAATTETGNLVVGNLLTDLKTEVWRATTTSGTITVTWTNLTPISFVGLPFCNLTPSSTVRVKLYSDTAGTTLVLDTGTVSAVTAQMINSGDVGMPTIGVNSFGYGGGNYADVWFAQTNARRLEVIIADSTNASGYIECARLVCGTYWSPANNPPIESVRLMMGELSKHERSDAGDLFTDRGPIYKTLQFNLQYLPSGTDRDTLWRITRGNGMTRPVYVSLTPDSADALEEQMFQVYGKLSRQSEVTYQYMGQYAASLSIEEI